MRGISSVGRAPALHAGGHRFNSGILHHIQFCPEARTGQRGAWPTANSPPVCYHFKVIHPRAGTDTGETMTQKQNKIVLLYPRLYLGKREAWQKGVPLPILAVAAPLLKEDYEVVLVDGDGDDTSWMQKVVDNCGDALLLGISSMSGPQIHFGLETAKAVRAAGHKLPIIWGGYHPSVLPEQTSQNPYVDAVVRGQGEVTMLEIAGKLSQGEDYTGVDGITFTRDGATVSNPDRPLEDINNFPRYPYEKLDNPQQYVNPVPLLGERAVNYISSQGCPFRCQFCAEPLVYGSRWKSYTADRVLADLEYLKHLFRVGGIMFSDPNYFVKEKRAREISQRMVEADMDLRWLACARASQVIKFSDESLQAFKSSGLQAFYIGAESGSEEMLNLIKKDIKLNDTIAAARRAADYGIRGIFSFIVGFPGETKEDVDQTWKMLKQITEIMHEYRSVLAFYQPTPGTALYDKACQMGWQQPQSLEEWASFRFLEHELPWMNQKIINSTKQRDFYFTYGYPLPEAMSGGSLKKRAYAAVAHSLGSFRCRHEFWRFPADWWLMKGLRG